MQTEIAYDNQERCYQLIAGNGVELGSYPKRHEAVEAQLALEAPQALELAKRAADRYPVLASRALRAAQLVATGKVHLDGSRHRVESQTCTERSRSNGAGEYRVEQTNGTWQCSCPDWQASIAGEPFAAPVVGQGPKCKHILAVLMAIKLGQGDKETRGQGDTSSPRLPLSPSPCLSLWDQQQAIARFQEYVRKVQEEHADPRLLFVLSQTM
jgi:hypothetical protein